MAKFRGIWLFDDEKKGEIFETDVARFQVPAIVAQAMTPGLELQPPQSPWVKHLLIKRSNGQAVWVWVPDKFDEGRALRALTDWENRNF